MWLIEKQGERYGNVIPYKNTNGQIDEEEPHMEKIVNYGAKILEIRIVQNWIHIGKKPVDSATFLQIPFIVPNKKWQV